MRARRRIAMAVALAATAACEGRGDAAGGAAGAPPAAPAGAEGRLSGATWTPPSDSEIPDDSLGASIRRGLALVTNTTDSLPRYAPGDIDCTNCHLDGGRAPEAAPITGSHARYPKYMDRTGAVVTLASRVNYCFTRSLSGTRLPEDSREMQDILAYLAFLSRGVPMGESTVETTRVPAMPEGLVGDTARGAPLYRTACAACHGVNGEGNAAIPPGVPALWGPSSYSIGASMAREGRAAAFIWHNMPLGQPRSLTPQQAYDVAAYVNAQPRPDSPAKAEDWPAGGAPKDVPYDTRGGHRAYRPPARLLPRADPEGAVVPAPRRVSSAPASTPSAPGGR